MFDEDTPIETLNIDILNCESGWLDFKVKMGSQENTIHTSAVYTIFPDLLSWLKAIATGVAECAFRIDEEGRSKRMHAARHPGNTMLFTLQRCLYDAAEEREYYEDLIIGYVDTYDFVRTLYTTFRDFYQSDRYDIKTNESLYLHKLLKSKFGKSMYDDEVMDTLLAMKGNELRHLFLGIAYADVDFLQNMRSLKAQFLETVRVVMQQKSSYKEVSPYWFDDFDALSPKAKADYLLNAFHEDVSQASYAFDLQAFKSKQIEIYLLSRSKKDYFHRDTLSWDPCMVTQSVTGIHLADVKINGVSIYDDLFLNIEAFVESTQASGAYPLFVCGCSDEGCGGVFKSPKVTIKEETILWDVYQPQRYTFRFDKQVLSEQAKLIEERIKDGL